MTTTARSSGVERHHAVLGMCVFFRSPSEREGASQRSDSWLERAVPRPEGFRWAYP
jgi:hypothetical protein